MQFFNRRNDFDKIMQVVQRLACVAGVWERGTGERRKGPLQTPFCLFLRTLAVAKFRLDNSRWAVNTVNSRVKSFMCKRASQFLIGKRIDS